MLPFIWGGKPIKMSKSINFGLNDIKDEDSMYQHHLHSRFGVVQLNPYFLHVKQSLWTLKIIGLGLE
jgi:hypothetical protein